MGKLWTGIFTLTALVLLTGCGNDPEPVMPEGDLSDIPYDPQPFVQEVPEGFPSLEIPADNPMTMEGVLLGRKLFFDPILSRDSTMSCFSCHQQEGSFTDNVAFSTGVEGLNTRRSSMSLLNVGFHQDGLFWDGRVKTLEELSLIPIEDPLELNTTWPEVLAKLREHPDYPAEFRKAFGVDDRQDITKEHAAKAIAQYLRTIVSSGNSKFDRFMRGEIFLSESEYNGFDMFFDVSTDLPDAECGHCHAAPLFMSADFRNNGLDDPGSLENFQDKGRGWVTGDVFDNGRFKVPTLRNIEYSAPYMHDGRFETLEEVIEHYNSGGNPIVNTDPLIYPLNLTNRQKQDLIAFIRTLADTTVLNEPFHSNPFE